MQQGIRVISFLSGLGQTITFLEASPPIPVASNLKITVPIGVNVTSATVSFTNWQAEDRVSFTNSFGLQHSFIQDPTAQTATLTITGAASGANYQSLLQSVAYQDVAANPIMSLARFATFTIVVGNVTASATQSVHVESFLSGLNHTTTYLQGSPPVVVAPKLTIALPAGLTISSATISLDKWQGEDRLSFTNSLGLQHAFTVDPTNHTATLTLTGTASASDYQTLLQSILYQDVAGKPNTIAQRAATFTIDAGTFIASMTQIIRVQSVLSG